jgi:hypothetical protein
MPRDESAMEAVSEGVPVDVHTRAVYEGDEPFVFVSYKHEDMARIQPILDRIQDWGYRIWYDRGILGGQEWAGVIEGRVRACRLFLLFLSQAAIEAEFVRKEVHLAIYSQKPLLVICLEPIDLKYGLGLLLQDRQMLDTSKGDVFDALERALRSILTAAFKPLTALDPEGRLDSRAGLGARSIGTGLSALTQLMFAPEVRAAVDRFQADFAAASERVGALGDYKDLHDQLHTLQFQCFNPLVQEAKHGSGEPNWDNVDDYALTLQNVIGEVVRLASRGAVPANQAVRHQQLLQAGELLRGAIDHNNPAQLDSAIALLKRVLDVWPSQINARLNEAARHLPLPALEQAMKRIHQHLASLDLNSDKVHQFGDGVEALTSLNVQLATLVSDHDQWQTVDVELRQVESQPDLGDLVLAWPMLKGVVDPLCEGSPEPWAISLGADSQKLESALDANDPVAVRQAFRRFRRQADERFYRVDVMLKRLCDDLRQVGEPLAAVLKVIG